MSFENRFNFRNDAAHGRSDVKDSRSNKASDVQFECEQIRADIRTRRRRSNFAQIVCGNKVSTGRDLRARNIDPNAVIINIDNLASNGPRIFTARLRNGFVVYNVACVADLSLGNQVSVRGIQ